MVSSLKCYIVPELCKLLINKSNQTYVTCSEMLEAVGHEYMEEFFGCCESLLAKDGIFVLQVSATCTPTSTLQSAKKPFVPEIMFT